MAGRSISCLLLALSALIISQCDANTAAKTSDSKQPVYFWAQDKTTVFIKVQIANPKDIDISYTAEERCKFHFSAKKGEELYVLDLVLLNSIDPSQSSWKPINNYVDIQLKKSGQWAGKMWKRLLLSREKPTVQRIDWARWVEDEDAEDAEDEEEQADKNQELLKNIKKEAKQRKDDPKKPSAKTDASQSKASSGSDWSQQLQSLWNKAKGWMTSAYRSISKYFGRVSWNKSLQTVSGWYREKVEPGIKFMILAFDAYPSGAYFVAVCCVMVSIVTFLLCSGNKPKRKKSRAQVNAAPNASAPKIVDETEEEAEEERKRAAQAKAQE